MGLRGNLRHFSLTQLLNLVHLARKTGALTLVQGHRQGTLYFREGMLVHLSHDGQVPNLRHLLERMGEINEVQSRFLPREARSDKEWGLILINTGLMNRMDIIEALGRHTLETVCHLFTWMEGDFLFEPNVLPSGDKISVSLDPENVILEGSRRAGESKGLDEGLPNLGMALTLPHSEALIQAVARANRDVSVRRRLDEKVTAAPARKGIILRLIDRIRRL